eukprot:753779-Hanusia_phi.AAC.7
MKVGEAKRMRGKGREDQGRVQGVRGCGLGSHGDCKKPSARADERLVQRAGKRCELLMNKKRLT